MRGTHGSLSRRRRQRDDGVALRCIFARLAAHKDIPVPYDTHIRRTIIAVKIIRRRLALRRGKRVPRDADVARVVHENLPVRELRRLVVQPRDIVEDVHMVALVGVDARAAILRVNEEREFALGRVIRG